MATHVRECKAWSLGFQCPFSSRCRTSCRADRLTCRPRNDVQSVRSCVQPSLADTCRYGGRSDIPCPLCHAVLRTSAVRHISVRHTIHRPRQLARDRDRGKYYALLRMITCAAFTYVKVFTRGNCHCLTSSKSFFFLNVSVLVSRKIN